MAAIGSYLALLHAWVAVAGAVVAAILVVLGVLQGLGAFGAKRWLDRLVLALFGAMVLAVLLGPGIVIAVAPPASALHFGYAAVAVAATPTLRLVGTRRGSQRIGWWVAAGALLTLGALLRLWATGG
jgi:hypothetical protein